MQVMDRVRLVLLPFRGVAATSACQQRELYLLTALITAASRSWSELPRLREPMPKNHHWLLHTPATGHAGASPRLLNPTLNQPGDELTCTIDHPQWPEPEPGPYLIENNRNAHPPLPNSWTARPCRLGSPPILPSINPVARDCCAAAPKISSVIWRWVRLLVHVGGCVSRCGCLLSALWHIDFETSRSKSESQTHHLDAYSRAATIWNEEADSAGCNKVASLQNTYDSRPIYSHNLVELPHLYIRACYSLALSLSWHYSEPTFPFPNAHLLLTSTHAPWFK